jgi:hypothetical protein
MNNNDRRQNFMIPSTQQYRIPQNPQTGVPLWAKILLGVIALCLVLWLLFPKPRNASESAAAQSEQSGAGKGASAKAPEQKDAAKNAGEGAQEKEAQKREEKRGEEKSPDKKEKDGAGKSGGEKTVGGVAGASATNGGAGTDADGESAASGTGGGTSSGTSPAPPSAPPARPIAEEVINGEHIANLELTIFPSFSASGISLEQTIKNLAESSRRHDPSRRGFRIVLSDKLPSAARRHPIHLNVRKKNLEVLLDKVCGQAGATWHVRNGIVEVVPTADG